MKLKSFDYFLSKETLTLPLLLGLTLLYIFLGLVYIDKRPESDSVFIVNYFIRVDFIVNAIGKLIKNGTLFVDYGILFLVN